MTTEQIILEAAEQEFMEKGMAGAKTTIIAKRAGVTHAMLHYYFRTKANLFDMVFQSKIQDLAQSVSSSFDANLPFFDQLRLAIETHFDYVARNPYLVTFVSTEVMANEERRNALYDKLYPRMRLIIQHMEKGLNEEYRKGTIVKISPINLFMNILSLNIMTFLLQPIFVTLAQNDASLNIELEKRKEANVQFIINAIIKK